jgi:predicted MFS family arabinose efflux permease
VLVLNLKLVATRDLALDSPLVMAPQMSSRTRRTVWLVCGAYGLFGIGIVPHTLLLSDYLFEDLGVSIDAASERFAVFGIGSLLGGVLVGGWFARWARASTRLVLASGLAVVSILIVPIAADAITVTVSALTMGTAHMGCVSVMSRRVDELVGLSRHTRYWGRATLWVGGGYASGAAVMAGVLSAGGSYASCFWIAGVAMIGAMCLYIMTSRSLGEQT